MPEVRLRIDGADVMVPAGSTVAAALAARPGLAHPVCAMGSCFACCVSIDGVPGRRACLVPCRDGMEVRRGG